MKNRRDNFHKELKELLLKYDAEIMLESEPSVRPYGLDEYKIVVEFNYDLDRDNEYTESIDLGSFEDGKN